MKGIHSIFAITGLALPLLFTAGPATVGMQAQATSPARQKLLLRATVKPG